MSDKSKGSPEFMNGTGNGKVGSLVSYFNDWHVDLNYKVNMVILPLSLSILTVEIA
jgi:hypothetical protein